MLFLLSTTRLIDRPSRVALALAVVVSLAAVLVLSAGRPALGSARGSFGNVAAPAALLLPPTPLAARGGGFRSRPRLSPDRPLSRNRPVARRNPSTGRALRNVSRSLMRALGIAFLLSLLFGIGPGGSPLGLLILLALIALVIVSRRRRRQYGYR